MTAVLRARCAFRMILHAENAVFSAHHPFHCSVQKIYMGDLESRRLCAVRQYRERVILRSYLYLSGRQITDRVVPSAMTEFEFVCPCTVCERYYLMPET